MKRFFDLLMATVIAIPAAPLSVLIAYLIKRDSPGPLLFSQERIGRNGELFNMLKFRTMVPDAEFVGSGLFSYEDDPRVTSSGRMLRKYSLDELPQLVNVFRGDMSIVGPRPPVRYELGSYDDFTPVMKRRFTVKPGMTGLAQVSGRNELSWPEKIAIDNEYLRRYKRFGILEDLRISWLSARAVLSSRGVVEQRHGGADA